MSNFYRGPKVVSSNLLHGEDDLIHYVIKLVSDLQQVGGFLRVLWFPPPIIWRPDSLIFAVN